ncbi:hypothetical protein D3C77_704460 [compost metagenome]
MHFVDQRTAAFLAGQPAQLFEFEGQACNGSAQLMGNCVGQLTLVGDQAFDAPGHLVEVLGQLPNVRAPRQVDA